MDTAHGCFAPLGARPFLAAVAAAREALRLGGDAEAPEGTGRRIDAEVLP